jgi:hypothetical protein
VSVRATPERSMDVRARFVHSRVIRSIIERASSG